MSSYKKGRREEEALVRLLRRYGLAAERIPLSGACDRRRADIRLGTLAISVKYGQAAPKILYRRSLCRLEHLYVLPLEAFLLGACSPKKDLPSLPCPKQVREELVGCDLLFARSKGAEWKVVGSEESLARLRRLMCSSEKTR